MLLSPNPYLRVRPVDVVRPLGIGVARFTVEFDCLAPAHLNGAGVLSQLFKLYDMDACGWNWRTTEIDDCGASDMPPCRRWHVRKV